MTKKTLTGRKNSTGRGGGIQIFNRLLAFVFTNHSPLTTNHPDFVGASRLLAFIFVLTIAYCLSPIPCLYASPPFINYHGRLRESQKTVTGNRFFEFKITNENGSQVYWTSGSTQIYVTSGGFNIPLGPVTGVDFSDTVTERYLEVKVGASSPDTTLLPRERIVSNAYAFYASTAGALINRTGVRISTSPTGTANIQVTASGDVGIGKSPSYKLDVAGIVNATALYVDGAPYQGSQWTTAGTTIYYLNRVAIGTNTATALLHINDDATASQGYIRATNFNPIPITAWPGFDASRLTDALWVGWDNTAKAWKYNKQTGGNGTTDPGNPNTWTVNGTNIGYFDGKLKELPTGAHINNRYNPGMVAYRCNQDDIQVKVGAIWVDKYPTRIIDVGSGYSGSSLIDDPASGGGGGAESGNAQATSPFWMAFSQKAQGSTGMTWFVASAAAANAGKRLLTNGEWSMAASGTGRTSGSGVTNGDSWGSVGTTDLSRYGCVGMAGNLWEWVGDWFQAGTNYTNSGADGTAYDAWDSAAAGYNDDNTWNVGGRAYTSYNGINAYVNGLPAAAFRGGGWGYGPAAGVFAFTVYDAPSDWDTAIGFRSCR